MCKEGMAQAFRSFLFQGKRNSSLEYGTKFSKLGL
jgi:hypothetical protein